MPAGAFTAMFGDMSVAHRHLAAVSALALSGHEAVLEIGCGHGVAARLVLDRLTTGRLTALDRSAKMIAMVEAGAAEALASGRLVTRTEALEDADFGDLRFDAIFAVNLDLNLRLGARWAGLLRGLLKPGGRIVLAFEPPEGNKGHAFAGKALDRLAAAGFVAALLPAHGRITVIRADLA